MFYELETRGGPRVRTQGGFGLALKSGLGYGPLKRAFDAIAALVLLVLASPLFLALAVLVRLGSRGPAIYQQARLGKDGRPFTMYKFRTMAHDCERASGPVWSTGSDPRVTALGRFLRRTHLDEIPQLWNILRGEMSFVGPRPERPEIIERLVLEVPRYRERMTVAPGLTGLAQVQIPPDTGLESVRSKLRLDLDYIDRLGLLLDLKLLACTALFLAGIPFRASCRLLRVPNLAIGPGFEGDEGLAASMASSLQVETA